MNVQADVVFRWSGHFPCDDICEACVCARDVRRECAGIADYLSCTEWRAPDVRSAGTSCTDSTEHCRVLALNIEQLVL